MLLLHSDLRYQYLKVDISCSENDDIFWQSRRETEWEIFHWISDEKGSRYIVAGKVGVLVFRSEFTLEVFHAYSKVALSYGQILQSSTLYLTTFP